MTHRAIGFGYLILSLIAVILGSLLSLVMRLHLTWPAWPLPLHGLVLPEEYLALVTMHGNADALLRADARTAVGLWEPDLARAAWNTAYGLSTPQTSQALRSLRSRCSHCCRRSLCRRARPLAGGRLTLHSRRPRSPGRGRAMAWTAGSLASRSSLWPRSSLP